ncbi:MAG: hypothetical protein IPJ78_17275 [Gemmatimonadetes bacterium]|nr:hypothetical protein [Gemmatimonadota bacterium]
MTRLVRWTLLGIGTLPTALFAQVVVRVTDPANHAVSAAIVEFWSANERVATRVTDSDGLARFVAGERARSNAAIVRRIGFLPGHLVLGSTSDTVVVSMEPLSGSLPSVTVLAARQACPQTDSPEARKLWQEIASRYETPSTQGRKANVEERRATVAEDQVGAVGIGNPRTGWRFYTHGGMTGARASFAQRGYIQPLTGTHSYDDFGAWRYPPLHAEMAGHFVDAIFGEAHTLTLSRAGSRNIVLRFCARDRRRNGLDGVMRVGESGGLADARWTYWNPARDGESAGGEVVFTPLAESGHAPLFSASGLFWRRLPSKRYLQSWQDYSAWELLADSVGTNSASRRPAP